MRLCIFGHDLVLIPSCVTVMLLERFWKGICQKMCTTDASPCNVKMQIVVEVSDTQSKRGFVQWTLGKLLVEVGLFGIGKVKNSQ